jgi:hypothetical protein
MNVHVDWSRVLEITAGRPAGPHKSGQWVESPALPPRVKHLLAAVSINLGIELRTEHSFIHVCSVFGYIAVRGLVQLNLSFTVVLYGRQIV